jgi:FHA domain
MAANDPQMPSIPELAEHPCPNCGQPMLAAWGATCGRCKPKLAYPKTVMLSSVDVAGVLPLALGWMVVVRSPGTQLRGTLIELADSVTILSRADAAGIQGGKVIAIDDGFMSAAHATIRRPAHVGADAAFTIEDRRNPGPSANGTFVNSRKLGPAETVKLGDGDVVRVGATELKFKSLYLPAAVLPR